MCFHICGGQSFPQDGNSSHRSILACRGSRGISSLGSGLAMHCVLPLQAPSVNLPLPDFSLLSLFFHPSSLSRNRNFPKGWAHSLFLWRRNAQLCLLKRLINVLRVDKGRAQSMRCAGERACPRATAFRLCSTAQWTPVSQCCLLLGRRARTQSWEQTTALLFYTRVSMLM